MPLPKNVKMFKYTNGGSTRTGFAILENNTNLNNSNALIGVRWSKAKDFWNPSEYIPLKELKFVEKKNEN
jgi:hypothetical protein